MKYYEAPENVKHWSGTDPSNPPERGAWCSDCERWEDDCRCTEAEQETNVQKFDREIGLDQESAASWRKRWEAEQADKRASTLGHGVSSPHPYWCWCEDCKERE